MKKGRFTASIITWERNGPEHHGVPLRHWIFEPIWTAAYIDHVQISVPKPSA